jgi:hypothetical protein
MRLFTLIVSIVFIASGILMIASGDSQGWLVAGFFGLCLLVAILEPRLSKRHLVSEYRVVLTADQVACEHLKRRRESIRWDEVNRIWYVTTSDGPWFPDAWLVLEGERGGCSFPTDATGFDSIWDELSRRFPGFDYQPLIRGGTDDARYLCWKKS